jgi:hypothetical protein
MKVMRGWVDVFMSELSLPPVLRALSSA